MTTLVQNRVASSGLPSLVPKVEIRHSELLKLLPAMYSSDDFMGRFLCIFEDTLKPLMQMADNLHYYLNPLTAPPELIAWLATWVNLALDENWSMEQRRKLVHSAADLYSRRGTKGGLIEYLKLYTGEEPEIAEYVDGMTLGAETFLGINTTIAGRERHSFTVTIRLQGLSEVEVAFKEANIRRIIESEKPAHTGYRLNLLVNGSGKQAVATNPDPPKPSVTPASNPVAGKAPPTSSASPKPNSNLDNKRGNAEPPPAIG